MARIILATPTGTSSELGERVLKVYWTLTALAALVLLLSAPAISVLSSAQIGGFLDGWHNPGAPPIPGTRAPPYWRWIAGLVIGVTAVWWTALGLAALRWRSVGNRLLGPALHLPAVLVRGLIGSGLFLILPSLWILLT